MFKEILADPKNHNPSNFVYMVSGFQDWNRSGLKLSDIDEKMERVTSSDKYFSSSLVGILDYKNAVRKFGYHRKIKQTAVFGEAGLILKPHEEKQVKIAWNCDIGSPEEKENLKEYLKSHMGKIRTPLDLLTKTNCGSYQIMYNELLVQGHPCTKIEGVFCITGKVTEAEWIGKAVSKKINENLPLIEIPSTKLKLSMSNFQEINGILLNYSSKASEAFSNLSI